MTRVRIDLFSSLDGYTAAHDSSADNPMGESCHYPDSQKWVVRSPERRLIRSEPLDYYDGEE